MDQTHRQAASVATLGQCTETTSPTYGSTELRISVEKTNCTFLSIDRARLFWVEPDCLLNYHQNDAPSNRL